MINIENYDFFAEGKSDFYNKFSHNSILCQGKHWKKHPLVTILIPTYKRPKLLQEALESALNQKGFSDYQIIIVDNEGYPLEEETPTSQVVKKYQDERVIYYRHDRELLTHRMDAVVRLARSPWIVFLHDDDILDENHLAIMTNVIQKYGEIKFLGCKMESFTSREEVEEEVNSDLYNCTIGKYMRDTTCLGTWVGWLGALISRKHYIAVGGMPVIPTRVGDLIMVAKFQHHFGTYICNSSKPLYRYRRGEQQLTFEFRNELEINRINAYRFYKYVIKKYHKLTHKIWERYIAYITLETCEKYVDSNIYQADTDIQRIISECGMPDDIQEKNKRYYATKYIITMYRKCVWFLANIYVKKIRKSDIYIAI